MIFSWQNCATNVVLQLMKGLNPLWCDCSDSNTAELKSSICYTCLPPSALADTLPGFPLLPNLHLFTGCSLRLGAVGEGARPPLMKPLLAARSEQKKKALTWAPPWWSVFRPTPTPTPVCFPLLSVTFIYQSLHLPLFLPSFLLCNSFILLLGLSSSCLSLFLHPWWRKLTDAYGSPMATPWAFIAWLSPSHTGDKMVCRAALWSGCFESGLGHRYRSGSCAVFCWPFAGRTIVILFEKRLKVGLMGLHIFQSEFTFCNCELSTDPGRLPLTLRRKDGFILSHGSTFTPDSLVKILCNQQGC